MGKMPDRKAIAIPPTKDTQSEGYTYQKHFTIDPAVQRKVLITGENSYIGESFRKYCKKHYPNIKCSSIDMKENSWREQDFSDYDCIFHVAGIAHADIGGTSPAGQRRYYSVNTGLAIEAAKKAKKQGISQFILMSSIIIYGNREYIDENTQPQPSNFYGNSKWLADKGVRQLADANFQVAVLRAPMIYGKGSKGNYPSLSKLARTLPVFPDVANRRSMLYIENLCEFVALLVLSGKGGIYFPQNREYTKTSSFVQLIADASGHSLKVTKALTPAVQVFSHFPGKISGFVNKAFGDCVYDHKLSEYDGLDYQLYDLETSIARTEGGQSANGKQTIWIIDHYSSEPKYGGISRQYDFAGELGRRGYHVVIIASGFSHFTHQFIVAPEKDIEVSAPLPNVRYIYLRTVEYDENGGIGRAKNMFSFLAQVLRYAPAIARKYGKPDVVTGCSVHPLAWPAAWKIARKYKARFVAEVRDFWPRIWVVGGEKKKTDPTVLFFELLQRWTFGVADRVIYSMYHGDKYLTGELHVPRGKVYLVGQPMDCKRFDINRKKTDLLPEEIRKFVGEEKFLDEGDFLCSFAGYYMAYEGVYVMLDALRILEKERGLPVKMVFVGSGQEKEGMEAFVEKNGLSNALICGRIAKEAVPALISHSDICMAHLEIEGHKEVYQYGVSKNKVNEYLYSGACTLYGFLHKDDEVALSGGGLMFEPYDSKDLADKIEMVYRMEPSERKQFGIRGREYIRNTHSVEVLTDRLLEVLFK